MLLTEIFFITYVIGSSATELMRECPVKEIQHVSQRLPKYELENKCTRGDTYRKGRKKYDHKEKVLFYS